MHLTNYIQIHFICSFLILKMEAKILLLHFNFDFTFQFII